MSHENQTLKAIIFEKEQIISLPSETDGEDIQPKTSPPQASSKIETL